MSYARNIVKNFIALGLSQALTTILSLILVILITRFIGDEGYGKLSFAMSLAAILTVVTPLGLNTLIIREVARNKDLTGKFLGNTLLIELVLSILPFVAIAITANVMQLSSESALLLYIAGTYYVLNILSTTMKCIFRAFEKMEYEAFLNFVKVLATLILSAALILTNNSIISVAYAYLIAAVFDFVLTTLLTTKRFLIPKLEFDCIFLKKMIPVALPFSAMAFLAATYTQIDIIILKSVEDNATVGWYKATTALVYALGGIPIILSSAIFPAISRFYISSKESLRITIQKASQYLMMLAFPIMFATVILAKPIIIGFYGVNFLPGVPSLQILAFFIPLNFINSILGIMLFSADKQRLRLICYLISTAARILMLLTLVPHLSLTGAAITTLTTEALLFALLYYFGAKEIPNIQLFRIVSKPLIVSIAMAVFIYLLKEINLIILVIFGCVFYFLGLYLINGFDYTDRAIIKDVIAGIVMKKGNR